MQCYDGGYMVIMQKKWATHKEKKQQHKRNQSNPREKV